MNPEQKAYRLQVVTVVFVSFLIAVVLGFLGAVLYQAAHRAQDRRDAKLFFCIQIDQLKQVQRDDINKRIATQEKFLRDHPHGIPGIPARLIQQGIENSIRLREKLRSDVERCLNA